MSSGATLVEQHADLLSFIATKERKCLDLREGKSIHYPYPYPSASECSAVELKRHEDDLKGLKKKWESIVARDQQASSTSLQPGSSSHTSGGRSPRSPASPNMQSSSSLDSQTSRQFPHSIEDAPLTMGVGDVTAARKWMGSWMKSGVAGVSGIIEGMSEARSSSDLGTVREEEEDVESDAKRSSQASSNASTTATSVSGAETTSKPDENNNTLLVKIDEDDSEQQPTNTRVRQQQQQQSSSERDFKGLLDKQNRRSVFDMGHNINWGDT